MLEQPDSPTASHTKQQVFDHYLYRLQNEIHAILTSQADYEERVKSLETDLTVFKRACFAAETEKRALHDEISLLKGKLEAIESTRNITERKIVCLIDGDGAIFTPALISKGRDGGRLAATKLSESVHFHMQASAPHPCQLWTYVFYNKRGLLDLFSRAGGECREAREGFEEFAIGFNQASERFIMVDVGNGKEAADAKIKTYLDHHTNSIDTYKVIFGGCHDTGYIPQLQTVLTSPNRDKLVLLPGYTEIPPDLENLGLPSLVIPELFIPSKIVVKTSHSRSSSASSQSGPQGGRRTSLSSTSSLGPPPGLPRPSTPASSLRKSPEPPSSDYTSSPPPPPYPTHEETDNSGDNENRTATIAAPTPTPDRRVVLGNANGNTPMNYRAIVQSWPQNSSYTYSGFASDTQSDSGSYENNVQKITMKQRKINRSIPLSQHDPPPCTLFYLAANGCKHGAECRFGHDYILDDDDYENMRLNAKKVPCPSMNRGEVCVFGENCCYGHMCPFLTRCHYLKQGKCKFSGPSMHRET